MSRRAFDREKNEERVLRKAAADARGILQNKAGALEPDTASTASASTSAVEVVSADAGATWTSAEQDLVNELKADLTDLVAGHNALVEAFNLLVTDHNDLLARHNSLLTNLKASGHME